MPKNRTTQAAKLLEVRALRVNQWLKEWESVEFDKASHRREPDKHFYVFSLSAKQLRMLSGVYRRVSKGGKKRSLDLGIQRAHELSRSKNIAEYIKYGYPWSDLSKAQRQDKYNDLRKPGWLPTAIVVNILTKNDKREGEVVDSSDLITIDDGRDGLTTIRLPLSTKVQQWRPKNIHPLEVIDGQHRLLAFDDNVDENYQLPVVAFHGLDLSWQAYLFWTINIKPKRINPSLAFDLYPLLRTEEWLERSEGHKVYREARAQELVEQIWSEPKSAWHQRINMLGESGGPSVTQAAWVRALLKTYIKSFEGRGVSVGGLYGAPVGKDRIALPWKRNQQSALLISLWNEIERAVKDSDADWARSLRDVRKQQYTNPPRGDLAFVGTHSLLNNDQGVTVVLNVSNDLLFVHRDALGLNDWKLDVEIDVATAVKKLEENKKISAFISKLAASLAKFDWRSSAARGLTEQERLRKLSYRGGSGYREFRRQLLMHLCAQREVSSLAREVYKLLGFDKKDAE